MNKKFDNPKELNNPAKVAEFENNTDKTAENSAAIGACKHVSDRVKANNQALKQFYRDCKLVDSLPIDESLKCQIVCQLVSTIKDCFVSLAHSI